MIRWWGTYQQSETRAAVVHLFVQTDRGSLPNSLRPSSFTQCCAICTPHNGSARIGVLCAPFGTKPIRTCRWQQEHDADHDLWSAASRPCAYLILRVLWSSQAESRVRKHVSSRYMPVSSPKRAGCSYPHIRYDSIYTINAVDMLQSLFTCPDIHRSAVVFLLYLVLLLRIPLRPPSFPMSGSCHIIIILFGVYMAYSKLLV
jgi:hypothetical protein